MDQFIRRENLVHYRRLLADPNVASDAVRHKLLIRLLRRPYPMDYNSGATRSRHSQLRHVGAAGIVRRPLDDDTLAAGKLHSLERMPEQN